jgi:hypothetical protein
VLCELSNGVCAAAAKANDLDLQLSWRWWWRAVRDRLPLGHGQSQHVTRLPLRRTGSLPRAPLELPPTASHAACGRGVSRTCSWLRAATLTAEDADQCHGMLSSWQADSLLLTSLATSAAAFGDALAAAQLNMPLKLLLLAHVPHESARVGHAAVELSAREVKAGVLHTAQRCSDLQIPCFKQSRTG